MDKKKQDLINRVISLTDEQAAAFLAILKKEIPSIQVDTQAD